MTCALLMGFSGLIGIGLGIAAGLLLAAKGQRVAAATAHGPSDETLYGDVPHMGGR